jgi:hypothetical protein
MLCCMDSSQLVASAGISAVVSAVVSLLSVRAVTVQQARAAQAEAARRAVRQAVAPLLDELARYEYLTDRPEPKRTSERSHMDDHAAVVRIRSAAAELPAWRRALVDRRCRRVFGYYWTDLARDYPSASNDPGAGSVGAWFASSVRGVHPTAGRGPLDGLLHRAYCQPPGDALLKDLRRELHRLSAAR